MLTLTETLDRIAAIDTDPDIIRQACRRYITSTNASVSSTVPELATELIETYQNKAGTPYKLIKTLILALSTLSASTAIRGREGQLLDGVQKELVSSFINAVRILSKKDAKENPDLAMQRIIGLTDYISSLEKKG